MLKRLQNNKGAMLLLAYYVSVILTAFSIGLVLLSFQEGRTAEIQRKTINAFYAAEAGIARAIYDLRQDCINDIASPSWGDGNINSMNLGPDESNYFSVLGYSGNSFNGGSYSVELKNVSGDNNAIWIKSTGTVSGLSQSITAYVKAYVISPWHSAIFGGLGLSGEMMSGSFNAYGTVHLLATGLAVSDYSIDVNGSEIIAGNNYNNLAVGLNAKVPGLPMTTFGGESVETLSSNLWVKNGLVGLSGTATIAEPNLAANAVKETLDGAYVKDGFGGTNGSSNVYSDNGVASGYLLGDSVSFPSLLTAYGGYGSYKEYLEATSLVITQAADLNEIANITPSSNFNFTDVLNGYGSISMDGSGNLTVFGKVYIKGGTMSMRAGVSDTILYSGSGIILVEQNVDIGVHLQTSGNNSFPGNILGIMTPGDLAFSVNSSEVMGLFYAEGKITTANSVKILGSIVSNYFVMGAGTTIYQIPEAANNVPTDMIGSDATCFLKIVSWQKS